MEYLFILCAAFSMLFFVLLITNTQKRYEHRFLIAINGLLVMSSIHIFLFYRSAENFYYPLFSEINWAIPLLYGLLLWLYTRSLIVINFKMKMVDWLHFIPFVAFLIYLLFPILGGESNTFSQHSGYPALKLLINPLYLIAVVVILKKHDAVLKNHFSFIGKMHHYWLSSLAIGGLVLWFISSISLIQHAIQPEASTIAGDYIVLSVLSIYLFAMSYVGFSKTEIFQNKSEEQSAISDRKIYQALPETIVHKKKDKIIEPNKTDKFPGDKVSEIIETDHRIYAELLNIMDVEKPYLNVALSLNDLSSQSEIPAGKLSSVINNIGNKNFYDFINNYRIDAVKEALKRGDQKSFSLLGIAEACGFNSKASFYRIFKKAEGVTPAQYAKEHKRKV